MEIKYINYLVYYWLTELYNIQWTGLINIPIMEINYNVAVKIVNAKLLLWIWNCEHKAIKLLIIDVES